MFFVMKDIRMDKTTFSRRVQRPTMSLETATRCAIRHGGYILKEDHSLVGQAFNPSMPMYIGRSINIGSGEDCYV